MEGWCILMANLYSEIRPDLRPVADYLEERHITYRSYQKGSKKKIIRNSSKEQFLRFLLNLELILRQEVLHEDY